MMKRQKYWREVIDRQETAETGLFAKRGSVNVSPESVREEAVQLAELIVRQLTEAAHWRWICRSGLFRDLSM